MPGDAEGGDSWKGNQTRAGDSGDSEASGSVPRSSGPDLESFTSTVSFQRLDGTGTRSDGI